MKKVTTIWDETRIRAKLMAHGGGRTGLSVAGAAGFAVGR